MSKITKIVSIIVSFITISLLSSCELPMAVVGIPNPKNTVTDFFDCVCSGDFAKADEYISGVSISMKNDVSGNFSNKLYGYLLQSYSYTQTTDVQSDNIDAWCTVDFTYLDLNLLANDLKELSTKMGKNYIAESREGYVENKNDSIILTDEGAEKIAAEALDSLMTNPEKYYTTKN